MPKPLRILLLPAAALLFAGATAGAQESTVTGRCATPDTVIFRGATRLTQQTLRADAGLPVGAALNARDIQRAVKNLFATGQFSDVATGCEVEPDGTHAALVFTVRERPVLERLSVSGPHMVSESAVRDRIELPIGRPLDPSLVARAVQRIDSLYESKGYYLAKVTVDTATAGEGVALTFAIDEGHRLAVSGVEIEGNQQISDKAIVGAMKTKPEGFLWWKKGEFDEDNFVGDVTERIPQLYADRGFIDMQVVKDTVIIDRERGKALVEMTVREGPQYHIGNFQIEGARRFPTDELQRFYPFGDQTRTLTQTVKELVKGRAVPKDVFSQSAWEDATRKVQTAYANEGYIYASVRPVVDRTFVGPDSTPTVNLRWDIDERQPAIVNRVEIAGNDYTTENCIRNQIWVVPGDVFSQDRLIQSYQNISNLGFFDSPLPAPETRQANDQGDVDIIFHVKEKRTGTVGFGASVGQGTGLGGFLSFEQPNLFGLCKKASLQWQFGRNITDFELAYTDPAIKQSVYSGTVSAYHTRSRYVISNLGQTIRTGGQLQLGFPVPNSRFTRLYVSYGGEKVSYGSEGLTSTINCPNCFRSTIGLTADHDTRIDMPFPSAGVHQSVTAQFNGGPLGGTASFQRYTGEVRSYSTLAMFGGSAPGSQPIKIVTGLSARAGAILGNPGPFYVTQSFALGGVQFGEPLRGYPEFSITPRGFNPNNDTFQASQASFGNAFFTTTAELGLRFNQMLYIDAFYDAGNIWARAREFDPTRLFRGAGVGASVVTPLGPLGLDLGYGFDRTDALGRPDPKWQLHFRLGQMF